MNLRLLQLADSALPIGGYSHSWGLEAAIERGTVHDASTLERWTGLWLRHAVGPLEGVVVASVSRSVHEGDYDRAREANELLWASLAPPTLRHASRDMGDQLLALAGAWAWATKAVASLQQRIVRGWHHAPVFATLSATAGAHAEVALAAYLHQAALGVLGAGVRAIPIGHTHGQQVLSRLHDTIDELVHDLAKRSLETAGSFCPAYEVFCHAQSGLYTRLFRS